MEIEKLSENKMKIILNKEELSIDTTENIENIFSTQEFNKFFLSALNKAEKEINFNTNGYKLLVELFYQNDKTYSLVVTKYLEADYLKALAKKLDEINYINENKNKNQNQTKNKIQNLNNISNNNNLNISDNISNNNLSTFNINDNSSTKKLTKKINKKNNNLNQVNIFNTFDDFDNFIDFSNLDNTKIKKEFKHFSLYTYNNKYYLITEKKNKAKNLNSKINSALLEFSFPIKYTKNFEIKLQEHGAKIFYT